VHNYRTSLCRIGSRGFLDKVQNRKRMIGGSMIGPVGIVILIGPLVVVQLRVLVHIGRAAVLHLDGQRRDRTEGARLGATISIKRFFRIIKNIFKKRLISV